MSIINQDQIDLIHNQVISITRYFRDNFFAEEAAGKIYKLIRSTNGVRQLDQLTANQYYITMHHLRRLESAAYLYNLAISLMDRCLLKQMLDCKIIINDQEYKRKERNLEDYQRVHKKAKAIINFSELFSPNQI